MGSEHNLGGRKRVMAGKLRQGAMKKKLREGEVNRACSGYNGRLEWYFWRAVGKISFLEEIWWGE